MSLIKYTILVLLLACLVAASLAEIEGSKSSDSENDDSKTAKVAKSKTPKEDSSEKEESKSKPPKAEKKIPKPSDDTSEEPNAELLTTTAATASGSISGSMSGSVSGSVVAGSPSLSSFGFSSPGASQSSGLPSFSFSGFGSASLSSSPSAAPTVPPKPYSEAQPRARFFVGLVPSLIDIAANTMTVKVNGKTPAEWAPLTRYVPTSYSTLKKSDSSYYVELWSGNKLIIGETFELTEGTDYTIAAIVNGNGKAYLNAYVDNNVAPKMGMAKVRVVNTIAGPLAPSVNVISGFTPIFINVVTRDSTNYVEVPAGSLLTVTLSNGLPIVISNRMIADAGKVYTVFVTGSPNGLFGSVNAIAANMVVDSNGEMLPTNNIPSDKAMIRFAHFVNGGGSAEFIIPGLLPQTLNFGQVGAYSMVNAADLMWSVRYVSSFLPLKTGAVSLTGGKYYTLVLRKSLPDPLSGYVDITATLIVDENQLPNPGHATVRFVNYIEGGADKFDISVGATSSGKRIPYDGYSEYVTFSLSAGSKPAQDLVIYSHTYADTIYETVSGFEDTLNEQTVYTMWVAGGPQASSIVTFLSVDYGNGTDPAQVATDAFEAMVMNKMKDNFPGVSIALTDNTDARYPVVYARAFGYRSIINRWRLTVNARFTVPGISSLMVYTLAVKAMDEGMLDASDSLAQTLKVKLNNPALKPNKLKKVKKGDSLDVTLQDLFTHTSGFRDNYNIYKDMAVYKDDSDMDLCKFAVNYIAKAGDYYDKGNFANALPGKDFSYNNIDATVLACLLEKKYDMDFMDLAMEKIFMNTVPMPMSNTYYSYANWNPRVESQLFVNRGNGRFDQLSPLTWPVWPAYNLRTTPSDLAMFLDNVVGDNGGRILSPNAVEMMLTPFTDIDTGFPNLQIAWGWMVMTGVTANPLYGHPVLPDFPTKTAMPTGTAGHAWYDQVNGQGVVILANADDNNNVLPEILVDTFGAFASLKNNYARPPECSKIGSSDACNKAEECRWIKSNVCVKAEPDLP